MQVHDELVFEVREDQVEWLKEAVVTRMSGAAKLDVPLIVDTGFGPDWDTAH
jgi:DNA polymerase-1